MLYFSELFNNRVYNENKQQVGKIQDILFLPVETPLVTKFVVKTPENHELIIPTQHIKKNGSGFILNADYVTKEKAENEASLLRELQNQQIIDIDGIKVIRVNDVVINDGADYTISGIDIGVFGVLRWVGAAKIIASLLHQLNIRYRSEFIPWSEIEPEEVASGRIVLKSERQRLKRLHPEDLAEHLEHATIRNVLRSLRLMDSEMSARVIADLNVDYQREIFKRFSPSHAGKILSLIDADEAVDVLLSLDVERREEILGFIARGKKGPIQHLLRLAKTPIGHLMTAEFIAVPSETIIKSVIDQIKKDSVEFSELLYIYALNNEQQVVGVITVHELLIQKQDIPLYKVMNQNLILGRLTTPKEIVLRRMVKYNIYALPIVDNDRKLLGIVPLQNIAEDTIKQK